MAARLTWVLDHQRLTLWVATGTLALTALLYMLIPKGFFPDQDTGLIQGVSEAGESMSYAGHGASASRRSPSAILTDPDVESLSSFIGVDGNNVTLNSGRFLINLKPRGERGSNVAGGDPAPAQRNRRRCRASRCTCSRCRI